MTASAFPTPAGSEVDAQPDFELIESETPESGAKTPTEDQPEDAIKTEPEAETPSSDDADVKKAESEEEPTKPMIQNVYRHDCMYNAESCPTRWSKFAVIQEEQEKLEAEIASIPIVHRQIYSDDKEWVTFSVTVNDPHMRSLLSRALEGYFPDPDALDLQNWTFEQSYEPIVHRWDKLRSLHQEIKTSSTSTPEQIRSVDAFIEFAEPLIKPCIEAIAKTRESGKVSYDDLWQIYSPGQLCVTKFYEVETLVRVTKNHKSDSREIFEVQVEFLEWNGSRCALKKTWISMGKFEGSQKVKSFSLVPLSFTDNPDELRETMSKRGQKFQDLRGYHYRAYDGLSVEMGIPIMRPVTGRVIIDAHAFYRARNLVQLDDIKSAAAKAGGDDDEEPKGGEEADEAAEDSDAEGNAKKSSPLVAIPSPQQGTERQEDLSPLSDEDSLITSPWLIGFEIKTKKWARFCINNLTDIQWNDKAFDNLVSRGGEKHLAWEFVESKARSKQNVNDFVHEKGKGITILMFGPPGVGKTFTAEAVAERARVPLYVISAGVLSTKPAELEAGLDHALELCRMWNAMLLLDEADVFLSVRSDEGLMRNELVSIFLTKLEYYQGILFLTTNRFSSIDHAFQSRVDLFLPYYDLDATSRRQVWQNFFAHFGQDKFKGITDREMDRLCDLNLNGREIKNLCKSALLLSERDISADKDGRMMAEKLYMLAEKRVTALRLLGQGSDDRMVGRH